MFGVGEFNSRYKSVEVLKPHNFHHYHFVTRTPSEVTTYTSIVKPFSLRVWSACGATLFFLLIAFYVTHSLYSSDHFAHEKLHKGEGFLINFVIGVYFKLTEPEAIDWYTDRWSTGRLLAMLRAFLCFFLVTFYQCNLRAHLASIGYEDTIDTNQDVINHGKTVWILTELEGNLYVQG